MCWRPWPRLASWRPAAGPIALRRSYIGTPKVTPQVLAPEDAILAYVEAHGRITRREVVALCDMAEKQAEYQLKKLVNAGQLHVIGRGRNAHYELAR